MYRILHILFSISLDFWPFKNCIFFGLCTLRHEKHRIYHTRWDITAVFTHTDHYFVFNRTHNSSSPLLSVQTKESLVIIWLTIASFLKISINCHRAAREKQTHWVRGFCSSVWRVVCHHPASGGLLSESLYVCHADEDVLSKCSHVDELNGGEKFGCVISSGRNLFSEAAGQH